MTHPNHPNHPADATRQPATVPHPTAASQPPKAPGWSTAHAQHLSKTAPELAAKWIADNADSTSEQTQALIKRAFTYAFHAGAGCNHALNERGI